MLRLKEGVLEHVFEHLRRCGRGRDECIVYLTGPVGTPDVADAVVHPAHTAGPGGYDLDSKAIGEVWAALAASGRSVRMQVHTHPEVAYHSSRDDALALVHTSGFLSLVIPRFALGEVGFGGAFLAERSGDGRWVEAAIRDRLTIAA